MKSSKSKHPENEEHAIAERKHKEKAKEVFKKIKEIKKLKCIKLSPIPLNLLKELNEEQLNQAERWVDLIYMDYFKPLKSIWESATPERWAKYKLFDSKDLPEYKKLRTCTRNLRDIWNMRPEILKKKEKENEDPK